MEINMTTPCAEFGSAKRIRTRKRSQGKSRSRKSRFATVERLETRQLLAASIAQPASFLDGDIPVLESAETSTRQMRSESRFVQVAHVKLERGEPGAEFGSSAGEKTISYWFKPNQRYRVEFATRNYVDPVVTHFSIYENRTKYSRPEKTWYGAWKDEGPISARYNGAFGQKGGRLTLGWYLSDYLSRAPNVHFDVKIFAYQTVKPSSNIRLDRLELVELSDARDQQIELEYTHTRNKASGSKPIVAEFWFLNADGIGIRKFAESELDARAGRHLTTLPSSLLRDIPEGAASIAAIADRSNQLSETDETDNFLETDLPGSLVNTRLQVKRLEWITTGANKDGVRIQYRLQKGNMPLDLRPAAKFYWSHSPVVPNADEPAFEKELDWTKRDGSLEVSPSSLGRTWRGEPYLIATIEMPSEIAREEYRVRRKYSNVAAHDGFVSPALGMTAKAPAKIKVASWLAQHERIIRSTAKRFRISNEALAAALAYQALTVSDNDSELVDLFGYDAMAVEATAKYRRGLITPKIESQRGEPLNATETIRYVAGIMRGYAFEAKRQGFDINRDVETLTSLFSNQSRRGTSNNPQALYTGIRPTLLPKGGRIVEADPTINLGNPLFTEYVEEAREQFKVHSWRQVPFRRSEQTFVLVHGFQSSPAAWSVDMAGSLRSRFPSSNILIVDWSKIAYELPWNYHIPAGLTAAVGREIGNRLARDARIKIDPSKLHFIGHSLGAHVSGAAATAVRKALDVDVQQVTGLDPAGPYGIPASFKGLPTPYRLDPSDAKRVVALHTTNVLGFGSELGDLDVRVNWNKTSQPGEWHFVGNHSYAPELLRQLIEGYQFGQSSSSVLGTHLDWGDVLNSVAIGAVHVNTVEIPDSGFGVFVSPQHLVVRGALDTTGDSEFQGVSNSVSGLGSSQAKKFRVGIQKSRVIKKGDSAVTLVTLNRPIAGIRPINANGKNFKRTFKGLALPGRLAQDVQRWVAVDTHRSGHINLGTANYYFKRLKENGRQLQANRQIANWVKDNSTFLSEALVRTGRRNTRLVQGDINNDLEIDSNDHTALRDLIAKSRSMTAENRRVALLIADLNGDQQLDARDLTLMQQKIESEQADFQANTDQVSVIGGLSTRINVLSNDNVHDKRTTKVTWIDEAANGKAEVIDGRIHYQPRTGFVGEDAIRYIIESEDGRLSEALLRINVLTAHIDEGVLQINGSAANDNVELSEQNGWINVDIDGHTATINRDTIRSIRFEGHEGDDRFLNHTSKPSFASGGAGNDELVGGSGIDEFFGNLGNDSLSGGGGADRLFGESGNDRLFGGRGADFLFGGDGADFLSGQRGHDELDGGDHDDHLIGGLGNDLIRGGQGNDTLEGQDGDDRLEGGVGNDTLYGNAGHDVMYGNAGNDYMFGETGRDTMRGGYGDDFLRGDQGHDDLNGGYGNDHLQGSSGNDTLRGEEGNDTLEGQTGDDHLEGGAGNDVLYGNAGNDSMYGNAGNDAMFGETGHDFMRGGHGDDFLRGDQGNDKLIGGYGNDHLQGEDGDDDIEGNAGNDFVEGGAGNDHIRGGAGVDSLYGNGGNDLLSGGALTDYIFGGHGNDRLFGDEGNDYLAGGRGDDFLDGWSDNWWSRRKRRFGGWIWR